VRPSRFIDSSRSGRLVHAQTHLLGLIDECPHTPVPARWLPVGQLRRRLAAVGRSFCWRTGGTMMARLPAGLRPRFANRVAQMLHCRRHVVWPPHSARRPKVPFVFGPWTRLLEVGGAPALHAGSAPHRGLGVSTRRALGPARVGDTGRRGVTNGPVGVGESADGVQQLGRQAEACC